MKITIGDVSVATAAGSFGPGEKVDIDEVVAKGLVTGGLATVTKNARKVEKATAPAAAEKAVKA